MNTVILIRYTFIEAALVFLHEDLLGIGMQIVIVLAHVSMMTEMLHPVYVSQDRNHPFIAMEASVFMQGGLLLSEGTRFDADAPFIPRGRVLNSVCIHKLIYETRPGKPTILIVE